MLVLYPNCCFASFHDKKTKLLHKKTFLELLMFCCPLKNWDMLISLRYHFSAYSFFRCFRMQSLTHSSGFFVIRHPWGSPSFTPWEPRPKPLSSCTTDPWDERYSLPTIFMVKCRYLEPKWGPLFCLQKKVFSNQNRGNLGSR